MAKEEITTKTLAFAKELKTAVIAAKAKYPFLAGKKPTEVAAWIADDWLRKEYYENKQIVHVTKKMGVENGEAGTLAPKLKPLQKQLERFSENKTVFEKLPLYAADSLY